ncbi:hypothetical protein [Streptomyces sp. HB132]|uniref:hypothetical protein n=1 Tax=Streptomyces sp. HB132 TaxID=767388 RepID=UPI0019610FDB|nr:hypothetical protein [Streptomyces sp. HB132]MBM7438856.1 hypothetical protein [Streptomyces sp. HB132]
MPGVVDAETDTMRFRIYRPPASTPTQAAGTSASSRLALGGRLHPGLAAPDRRHLSSKSRPDEGREGEPSTTPGTVKPGAAVHAEALTANGWHKQGETILYAATITPRMIEVNANSWHRHPDGHRFMPVLLPRQLLPGTDDLCDSGICNRPEVTELAFLLHAPFRSEISKPPR